MKEMKHFRLVYVFPEDTQDLGGGRMRQLPTPLTPLTLRSEVFITILDDDRKVETHDVVSIAH